MATLAETLLSLTDENDLTSISIHVHHYTSGGKALVSWNANAHYHDIVGRCTSANGDTPEDALAKAVAQANAIRGRGVDVPATIVMDDLPEGLAA